MLDRVTNEELIEKAKQFLPIKRLGKDVLFGYNGVARVFASRGGP